MRAIVVDDSRAMRLIVGRMLEGIGFEVDQAADGREALGKLCAAEPGARVDLAVVDVNMPAMNGFELVAAIRAEPGLASLKIVMCTAEAEPGQAARATRCGADGYVTKPFTAGSMADVLAGVGIPIGTA